MDAKKPVPVRNTQNGRVYQLLRQKDRLVFYYAAKPVREADTEQAGRDIKVIA